MPKYERLKQIIHNNIRDGVWKAGDRLPAERVLCDKFGVSKITVKRAKDDLLAEGVLENRPGRKGAFIRPTTRMPASGLIGVAIDDINDPHFSLVLKGIEDKLWENKLHTVLCNAYHDVDKLEAYFESLLQQNVAGVIFTPARPGYIEDNRHIVNMLDARQIPYVLVDRYIHGLCLPAVVSNNFQGSKDVTRLLIKRGHTRILTLVGVKCSSMNERLQGHLDALREAEIESDPRLVVRVNDIRLQGSEQQRAEEFDRIRTIMANLPDFTACYTMNSLLFQLAIRLSAPRDRHQLAIATYDYALREVIGLTNRVIVVKQPGYRMGWEAARLLLETLHNPDLPTTQISLQAQLIEEMVE